MRLLAHPATPHGPVRNIEVHAERSADGLLRLSWRLDADLSGLRVPEAVRPARVDGLWHHTCFEIFIARPGSPAYCELNFSPSGEWAAYSFAGYRSGMAPLELASVPGVQWRRTAGHLELDVVLNLDKVASGAGAEPLRLALSAIIEQQSGAVTCWALRHGEGPPDFHHPGAFVLELATRGPDV